SVRDDGLDLRQFQKELIDELRDLLMVKSGLTPAEGATEERLEEMREAVAGVATSRILTALKAFGEADLKQDPNSTLPLDIALAECVLGAETIKQSTEAPAPQAQTRQTDDPGRSGFDRFSRRETIRPPARPVPPQGRPAPAPTPPPWLDEAPPDEAPRSGPANGGGAPARAPSPPPAPRPTGPVDPSLEGARAAMRPIYERAKAVGFQLGALLNGGCDIVQAEDDLIVLGF